MRQILSSLLFLLTINSFYGQDRLDVFDIARRGTVEELRQLLKSNPTAFKSINREGFSPLLLACYRGNNEVAKLLMESGCDINQRSTMGTPLMAAVVKGNNPIAQYLLLKNADVNLTDENGITALMYAVMFKNKELVNLLLQKNADKKLIDNKGKSAFEYAVFTGNEEIINLLK
jgi:ankyrin repeat protein